MNTVCFIKKTSAGAIVVNSQSGINKLLPAEDTVSILSNMNSTSSGHCSGSPAARETSCKKLSKIFLTESDSST